MRCTDPGVNVDRSLLPFRTHSVPNCARRRSLVSRRPSSDPLRILVKENPLLTSSSLPPRFCCRVICAVGRLFVAPTWFPVYAHCMDGRARWYGKQESGEGDGIDCENCNGRIALFLVFSFALLAKERPAVQMQSAS